MAPETLGIREQMDLAPFVTLRAGGKADKFVEVRSPDRLADVAIYAQKEELPMFVLGAGSNVLPSDDGVEGIVIFNHATGMQIQSDGDVTAEAGCAFQDVFLRAAQAGLGGLEFAVGIPGTIGGALVSNAGAYRSNVSEFLTELEIVVGGKRQWVAPSWMQFSYRDSILRGAGAPSCAILRVRMKLPRREPKAIYDEAREYQRQRIGKQPAPASAGSFFKNVVDSELAATIKGLTDGMRKAGVIPAGFLIDGVGLKGYRHGGAMLSSRHANFMLNVAGASAAEIFELAQLAKSRVFETYGVALEEEVLYLGRWSHD